MVCLSGLLVVYSYCLGRDALAVKLAPTVRAMPYRQSVRVY